MKSARKNADSWIGLRKPWGDNHLVYVNFINEKAEILGVGRLYNRPTPKISAFLPANRSSMLDATWMEVSLTVDGELAEAVAEVMARYIPDGVAIESTAIIPDLEGEGQPGGPLRVCGYLPIDERLEETRRRLEEGLWYLGRIRPLPAAEYKPIQEINWVEAWKQALPTHPYWAQADHRACLDRASHPGAYPHPYRPGDGLRDWHPSHHPALSGAA